MSYASGTLGRWIASFTVVASLLPAWACSDDDEKTKEAPPPTVVVDTTMQPRAATIPGIDGGAPRPVASAAGSSGPAADFVADEMIVGTSDPAMLEAVRVRWNGTVLTTLDFGAAGYAGLKTYYLLRIDPTGADVSRIGDDMKTLDQNAHGEHRVSSEAAMSLMAAIAEERMRGDVEVAANWIATSASFDTRSTADSPTGFGDSAASWTPNIYEQPGFRRGDAQDIGVGEAWRAMSVAGRFANKVKVVIMDGGFKANEDVPATTRIEPPTGWDRPNPSTCTGGTPCNWHGTGVAQIAFGAVDNGFGAAGVAAPVADPILVPSPSLDFMQIFAFVVRGVPALLGGHRIVNISGGTGIGAGWYVLTFGALDAIAAGVRLSDTLIVAAAGNDSQDVDAIDCLDILGNRIACWEGTVWIPCELPGVVCVGGLRYDSVAHDSGSNRHGDDESNATVDIHAPYWNWIGPDPDVAASGPNSAQLIAGTSGASPFVAGVAALVWAAKPSLSAGEVEEVLYRTAHSDVGPIKRRVNAYAAVRDALGGNTAPFVQLLTPATGSTYSRGRVSVPLALTLEDDNPSAVQVTWTSSIDGVIGTGTLVSTNSLSAGTHTITATIVDGGVTQTRTTTITIVNDPPLVQIVQPRSDPWNAYETQLVRFTATATDLNEIDAIPPERVTWYLGGLPGAGGSEFGGGNTATYTVPDGTTADFQVCVVGESSEGLTSNDCMTINPQPEPDNFPPDVQITFPSQGQEFVVDGDGDADVVMSAVGNDPELDTVTFTWYVRRQTGPGTWTPYQATTPATGASVSFGFTGNCGSTWEILVSGCDEGTGGSGPACTDYVITITVDELC